MSHDLIGGRWPKLEDSLPEHARQAIEEAIQTVERAEETVKGAETGLEAAKQHLVQVIRDLPDNLVESCSGPELRAALLALLT